MAPSTRRVLSGELRVYDVRDLTRVDSHLRELRHRLQAAGPQMLPRIWADINALLERRTQLIPAPECPGRPGWQGPNEG